MSRLPRASLCLVACLTLVAGGARLAEAQADQLSNVKGLVDQATVAFEQLDYENTIKALDSAIGAILARPTEEVRRLLPGAYEMRAKAQFGLNKEAEARADLQALFKADPGYTLTGQNSPKFLAIADEIVASAVTELQLSVVPPDAEVLLDGVRIPATGTLKVAVGDHTLSASRIGYKPLTRPFSAKAGEATVVDAFELERVSSVLRFVTSPANVEVLIDGISHGFTKPGPPPAEYAARAARVGIPAGELSAVLTVTEIPIGTHRITYRKDCYVHSERQQTVEQLADYVFDPVKLEPAVATVAVTSNQGGTVVLIDGQQRGVAPITISDVCEGEHVVELKSASGRDLRRVDARTGQRLSIEGMLRPAFAIVSASGPAALNTDLRITIEKQLQSSRSVMLFAPLAAEATRALAAEKLPPDWLAFDQNRRPIGTAAEVAQTMRADLARKLAKQFEAQGIASVTVPSPASRNRLVVALLADGSGEPDILEVNLDSPESLGQAVARLDRALTFFKPSIGVSVVDVADLEGPVVVGVEAGGPAAKSGVQPGDVLLKANGQDVPDAGALAALLAGRKADEDLTLELKDKAGAPKRADVKVFMTPRLVGLNDQSLMINRLLVDLRARAQTPSDPALESVMRLNMAVALARVGAWNDARTELQRVKLADGPGVANGTVLYLLGLVAERLGNLAEAEQSWRAAAATPALLTEEGPPVKELAETRLAELQKRPRGLQ
jgi:hypothetical protein